MREYATCFGNIKQINVRMHDLFVKVCCCQLKYNISDNRFVAGLPDPFAKISVDGSGQVYSTNTVKATLDPKWTTHYDLYLTKGDGITIR